MRLKPRHRRGAGRGRGGGGVGTPEQLVAAASEVFSESGYRGATVRDICRRAGANVAAVNYHFGGKEGLYAEVLRCGLRLAVERFPADDGVPAGASAEERLRGFVRSLLRRMLATGPEACQGRLLLREMVEPTPALDAVVATEIRGWVASLESVVGEILGVGSGSGGKATESMVALGAASVVSQVVFYHHCRQVIPRAFPGVMGAMEDPEALAGHIATFSLAGLRALAGGAGEGGDVRPGGRVPRRAGLKRSRVEPGEKL